MRLTSPRQFHKHVATVLGRANLSLDGHLLVVLGRAIRRHMEALADTWCATPRVCTAGHLELYSNLQTLQITDK